MGMCGYIRVIPSFQMIAKIVRYDGWVIINNTLHVHFFLLSKVVVRNGNRTVAG